MDDLELCKRIAEIDNCDVTLILKSDIECKTWLYNNNTGDEYNPLTDDALCFQLMVKYKVALLPCMNEWTTQTLGSRDGLDFITLNDKSPNRAILLAIIEAHSD